MRQSCRRGLSEELVHADHTVEADADCRRTVPAAMVDAGVCASVNDKRVGQQTFRRSNGRVTPRYVRPSEFDLDRPSPARGGSGLSWRDGELAYAEYWLEWGRQRWSGSERTASGPAARRTRVRLGSRMSAETTAKADPQAPCGR